MILHVTLARSDSLAQYNTFTQSDTSAQSVTLARSDILTQHLVSNFFYA